MIADLPNYGTVWYSPKSLANVLSLASVRQKYRVTMDTNIEPTFLVHKNDNTVLKFAEHKNGLYLHDKNDPKAEVCMVQTVKGNVESYHKKDVKKAQAARTLYILLGRPSFKKFTYILDNNYIPNCSLTGDDARRAEDIYGKDVATIKGKSTHTHKECTKEF